MSCGLRRSEEGGTLVEVLVGLTISALVVMGVAGIYYQMVVTRNYVDDSVAAYTQIQRAGAFFSRDTVQAQIVDDNNLGNDATLQIAVDQDTDIAGTEVLVLQWTDWNDDVVRVYYSLADVAGSSFKELMRTTRVNGNVVESHVAGENLDSSIDTETSLNRTRLEWVDDDKEIVRLVVTSEYGQESVTRMYEARPRARV